MIKTIHDCNGCEICRRCSNFSRRIVICDKCGYPKDAIYHFDDKHLCIECIADELDEVDVNEE